MAHPVKLGILTGILILLFIGCSGQENPTSPVLTGNEPSPDLQVTSQTQEEPVDANPGHFLWAFSEIYIDPAEMEYEIIVSRSTSTHWNILTWLEDGPCTDCFRIDSVTQSGNNTLLIDIEVMHPFDNPNLTGFDVRGIAMFAGSKIFTNSGLTTPDRLPGDGELVNADGYTTLYNWSTAGSGPGGLQGYQSGKFEGASPPTATLNGYKMYYSDDPLNTRNAFYAGESNIATFEIDMPDGPFIFGYAVDANWAQPLVKPVTDPMSDFPSSANCPEPWKIEVSEEPDGLGLHDEGGITLLWLDVYDWQGKDSHELPLIECEELFDGVGMFSWAGDNAGYTTFAKIIPNFNLAPIGEYECLISVRDTEADSAPEWLDLTAYQIFTLEVVEFVDAEPVAMASADPTTQNIGMDIHFTDDGSYDPDGGTIISHEWDWDNDGTFDEGGDDVTHSWSAEGTYYVQYRVTDQESSTDVLDEPIEINIVWQELEPIAIAFADPNPLEVCTTLTLNGSDSYDPDGGVITDWLWDIGADGSTDGSGQILGVPMDEVGEIPIQLRVIDDEGQEDLLDDPIIVSVTNVLPTPVIDVFPTEIYTDEPVNFSGGASIDNDCLGMEIVDWEWDWDNDGTYDESGMETTHQWAVAGTYYIQLRVWDDEGDFKELDTPYELEVLGPVYPTAVADFNPDPDTICDPVNFYDNGSTAGGAPPLDYAWWDWNNDGTWDDGGPFPNDTSHIWYTPGTYYVNYMVRNDAGFTDELDAPLEVVIENALPVAVAEVDRTITVPLDIISFYAYDSYDGDCGGDSITLYEWDFENDGTYDDTDSFVQHAYDTHGTYEVQLRVTDNEGATSTLTTPIEIEINDGWVRTWGGVQSESAEELACDYLGNVYVTGTFMDTVDFDPTDGVASRTSNGTMDIYLVKYNNYGEFQWVKTWGGTGYDISTGVAAYDHFNVFVCGYFEGSDVNFDPDGTDLHSSNGDTDAFISKFDGTGDYQFCGTWGSTGLDAALGMDRDDTPYLYVTGVFSGTVDFSPWTGTANRTSAGQFDCFLSKLGPSGTFSWVNTWGGSDYDGCTDASVANGLVYVTGYFNAIADFNPGSIVENHTSSGGTDIFIGKYTTGGSYGWAWTFGGDDADMGNAVYAERNNNEYIYVTGTFEDTVDFNPFAPFDNHDSEGERDVFLSRYNAEGNYYGTRTWGSTGSDSGNCIFGDALANTIYVLGNFRIGADFDPNAGFEWRNCNGVTDAFLSAFNTGYNLQWVRTWGGDLTDTAVSGSVNIWDQIMISGAFADTVQFEGSTSSSVRESEGSVDAYLARYSSSGTW